MVLPQGTQEEVKSLHNWGFILKRFEMDKWRENMPPIPEAVINDDFEAEFAQAKLNELKKPSMERFRDQPTIKSEELELFESFRNLSNSIVGMNVATREIKEINNKGEKLLAEFCDAFLGDDE